VKFTVKFSKFEDAGDRILSTAAPVTVKFGLRTADPGLSATKMIATCMGDAEGLVARRTILLALACGVSGNVYAEGSGPSIIEPVGSVIKNEGLCAISAVQKTTAISSVFTYRLASALETGISDNCRAELFK